MQIRVGFDDEILGRYGSRGSSLLFQIAFENDGIQFPHEGWVDFGCVVLGWWMTAIFRLAEGSHEEELCFMDGPYTLMAYRRDSELMLRASEGPAFEAKTSLAELRKEVSAAANAVLRHVSRLGLSGPDVGALQTGLSRLQQL
jgi:hypothetical protein